MNQLTQQERKDLALKLEQQIEELFSVFAEALPEDDAVEFLDYLEGLRERRRNQ